MQKKQIAFTLVELIVVITILAILGTISFISLQGYNKGARDSVRLSDISTIESGLELFNVKTGIYPEPSSGSLVTYLGSEIWNQGSIGDSVINNIQKINKKPLDPVTFSEYTYSRLNSKQEYQLGTILEGGLVINSSLINQSMALGLTKAIAYVKGNYNGKIIKTSTGGTDYILSLPSIISNDLTNTDIISILNGNKLVYTGYNNLPKSYTGTIFDTSGGFSFNSNKLVIYSGNIKNLKLEYNQLLFINNLKNSYSGTILANNSVFEEIISIDVSANKELAKNLVANYTNNNMGGLPNLGLKSTRVENGKVLDLSLLSYTSILGNATFTRSTTATATVKDFEGIIKTAKIGEVRFEGARRVENLLSYSEDFSNSVWSKTAGVTATKNIITFTASLNQRITQSIGVPGNTYAIRMRVRGLSGDYSNLRFISLGVFPNEINPNITLFWKEVGGINIANATSLGIINRGATAASIEVQYIQVENVTGQTNTNPSEYVSSDVITTPYHGANIDGVKYFNSENGNTVAGNIITEAIGNPIPINTLKGVLIEPQVTNLLFNSEDLNDILWSGISTTLPLGMNLLNDNSPTSFITKLRIVTVPSVAGNIISSVLIKKGTQSSDNIPEIKYVNTNGGNDGTERSVQLNPATGITIIRLNGTSYGAPVLDTDYGVIDEGNFYRLWIKGITRVGQTSSTILIWSAITNVANFGGVSVTAQGSLEIGKLQLETGNIIHNYIPTTTTTITKSADDLSYNTTTPTKDVSYVFDFTPYANGVDYTGSSFRLFGTDDTRGTNNEIRTFGSTVYGFSFVGGGLYINIKKTDIIKGITEKIGFSFKQVGANIIGNIVINGVVVYTSTFVGTLDHSNNNKLQIGNWSGGYNSGNFKNFKMYDRALTSNELINATK